MIFTDARKGTAESFLLLPLQACFLRLDCAIMIGYEDSLCFFTSFLSQRVQERAECSDSKLSLSFKSLNSPGIPDVILRAVIRNLSCSSTSARCSRPHIQPQSPVQSTVKSVNRSVGSLSTLLGQALRLSSSRATRS